MKALDDLKFGVALMESYCFTANHTSNHSFDLHVLHIVYNPYLELSSCYSF